MAMVSGGSALAASRSATSQLLLSVPVLLTSSRDLTLRGYLYLPVNGINSL